MFTLRALALGLAVAWGLMSLVWVLSLARRDASVVDTFWGPGFLVLAVVYALVTPGWGARKALVLALVALWAARLAVHIFTRNRGRGEDYRYRAWREQDPANFWWKSYFKVFMLQAGLLWLIAAPILFAQRTPAPAHLTGWDVIGALVWLAGMFWEAVGDWQLARFKQDPANQGQVMRTGLWAYTRHPNSFGEATLWWGVYLIAAGTPGGWLAVYGPVVITFMLLRVSGVALLEKALVERRAGYAEYIQSTSAFVPWVPRKK
jgi:steroid 5-alpha reductase family enzyme